MLTASVALSPVLYDGNVDRCRGAGAVDFRHGEVGVGVIVFVLGRQCSGVGNEDVDIVVNWKIRWGRDKLAKDNSRSPIDHVTVHLIRIYSPTTSKGTSS